MMFTITIDNPGSRTTATGKTLQEAKANLVDKLLGYTYIVLTDEYEVQPGDTLQKITKKLYDHNRWYDLWVLNKHQIPHPNRIKPGTFLKLPEVVKF